MKSLLNAYVEHIKFGKGLITNEDTGKITVEFTPQLGNKMFQFPDAFEQFLKFDDSSLQEECLMMLQAKKLKLEEEQRTLLELKKQEEKRVAEELEQKKKLKKTTKIAKPKLKKVISEPSDYDEE